MALLTCPECGNNVSQFADKCPSCGCPTSMMTNKSYTVVLRSANDGSVVKVIKEIRGILEVGLKEAKEKVDSCPFVVKESIDLDEACDLKDLLEQSGGVVDIIETNSNTKLNTTVTHVKKEKKVKCPKCNSTSISTGRRGYSFFTGFIGANKTVNRCANCGHSWRP